MSIAGLISCGLGGLFSPSGASVLEESLDRICRFDAGRKRLAAVDTLVESEIKFADAYELFATGCPSPENPKRGDIYLDRRNSDGKKHPYLLLVPKNYIASKRYPVRFYLHGGISRPPFNPGESWWRRPELNAGDWLTVYPASWQSSMWWQPSQIENLDGILDELKRSYNVDENRVYLVGVSDGGSGVYYHAMRNPTPWAAFLPFIGSAGVIANPQHRDGDFNLINLSNRPYFIVNGELDHLYPAGTVQPFVDRLEAAGAEVVFRPLPDVGHELGWWREEKGRIEEFITEHVRDPLPDRLVWETEDTERFSRLHWLVITELGPVAGESPPIDPGRGFFARTGPYGQVRAERVGNTIDLSTSGVQQVTLLVSPDQFDLAEPIRVLANGREYWNRSVTPSTEVLARWFAHDLDRSMLFAAEIDIDLASP